MEPFRSISPVKATSFLILIFVNNETIAKVIAQPADGPSFGVAASGQCK